MFFFLNENPLLILHMTEHPPWPNATQIEQILFCVASPKVAKAGKILSYCRQKVIT
jgi:hypothetical protein